MPVPRPIAALIGLFTVWPLVYMFIFFAFVLTSFGGATRINDPGSPFAMFSIAIAAHLGTMFIIMALLVFYIVHVFKNPALAGDKRTLWAVVLFMGSIISMPIYWFLYVWHEPVLEPPPVAFPAPPIPRPPSVV